MQATRELVTKCRPENAVTKLRRLTRGRAIAVDKAEAAVRKLYFQLQFNWRPSWSTIYAQNVSFDTLSAENNSYYTSELREHSMYTPIGSFLKTQNCHESMTCGIAVRCQSWRFACSCMTSVSVHYFYAELSIWWQQPSGEQTCQRFHHSFRSLIHLGPKPRSISAYFRFCKYCITRVAADRAIELACFQVAIPSTRSVFCRWGISMFPHRMVDDKTSSESWHCAVITG